MQAIVIDQKLKSLVQTERKITHEILLLIQTLDITKSYRELGYSSLFEYLVKEIGYSQSSAQRRISSARLMKQLPQIANDLKSGQLNLTQVSLAQVAIRQEEKAQSQNISTEQKKEILEKLKSKSTYETQKILKDHLPAFEIPKPKATPAGHDKVHVTLQFSERDWNKIQSLLAHFSNTVPDLKIESLLLHWHSQVEKKKQKQIEKLQINEPTTQNLTIQEQKQIEKVQAYKPTPRNLVHDADQALYSPMQINQITKTNLSSPKSLSNATQFFDQKMKSSDILLPLRQWKDQRSHFNAANRNIRSSIASAIQFQVRRKAQDRCQFISHVTGRRCESKHFLETEHRIPVAKGGTNAIQNLRLYCRSHNTLEAKIQGVSKSDI